MICSVGRLSRTCLRSGCSDSYRHYQHFLDPHFGIDQNNSQLHPTPPDPGFSIFPPRPIDTARHSPKLADTELMAEWRSDGVSVKSRPYHCDRANRAKRANIYTRLVFFWHLRSDVWRFIFLSYPGLVHYAVAHGIIQDKAF